MMKKLEQVKVSPLLGILIITCIIMCTFGFLYAIAMFFLNHFMLDTFLGTLFNNKNINSDFMYSIYGAQMTVASIHLAIIAIALSRANDKLMGISYIQMMKCLKIDRKFRTNSIMIFLCAFLSTVLLMFNYVNVILILMMVTFIFIYLQFKDFYDVFFNEGKLIEEFKGYIINCEKMDRVIFFDLVNGFSQAVKEEAPIEKLDCFSEMLSESYNKTIKEINCFKLKEKRVKEVNNIKEKLKNLSKVLFLNKGYFYEIKIMKKICFGDQPVTTNELEGIDFFNYYIIDILDEISNMDEKQVYALTKCIAEFDELEKNLKDIFIDEKERFNKIEEIHKKYFKWIDKSRYKENQNILSYYFNCLTDLYELDEKSEIKIDLLFMIIKQYDLEKESSEYFGVIIYKLVESYLASGNKYCDRLIAKLYLLIYMYSYEATLKFSDKYVKACKAYFYKEKAHKFKMEFSLRHMVRHRPDKIYEELLNIFGEFLFEKYNRKSYNASNKLNNQFGMKCIIYDHWEEVVFDDQFIIKFILSFMYVYGIYRTRPDNDLVDVLVDYKEEMGQKFNTNLSNIIAAIDDTGAVINNQPIKSIVNNLKEIDSKTLSWDPSRYGNYFIELRKEAIHMSEANLLSSLYGHKIIFDEHVDMDSLELNQKLAGYYMKKQGLYLIDGKYVSEKIGRQYLYCKEQSTQMNIEA